VHIYSVCFSVASPLSLSQTSFTNITAQASGGCVRSENESMRLIIFELFPFFLFFLSFLHQSLCLVALFLPVQVVVAEAAFIYLGPTIRQRWRVVRFQRSSVFCVGVLLLPIAAVN
jgi:hypothetical protein